VKRTKVLSQTHNLLDH